MDQARFNIYWILWLVAPAFIMFSAAYLGTRRVLIVGIILSVSLTYVLSNLAVIEKWDRRLESAVTEQQLETATADGANKVFTLYFFAPLEAVFFTWFWYWVGRKVWRREVPGSIVKQV